MDPLKKYNSRKKSIVNFLYFVIIFAVFYLFMKYALWSVFPFLCAFGLAMALQRPISFLERKTPFKRGISSTFLILLIAIAFIGPISYFIYLLFGQLIGLIQSLKGVLVNLPNLLRDLQATIMSWIDFLPENFQEMIGTNIDHLIAVVAGGTSTLPAEGAGVDWWGMISGSFSSVWSVAKQIPTNLIGILVATISSIFMTIEYPNITAFVKRQFPPEKRHIVGETKRTVLSSLGKMIKAYAIIISITFAEVALGLTILKFLGIHSGGFIFVIALLVAIVDILPVLGTGTIMLPWAVYNFVVGDIGMGIGLLVIYVAITIIRQIIEPKIVGAQLGLPAFVMLISMFFGVRIFGFIGLFLVPLIIVVLNILNEKGIVHLWRTKQEEKDEKGIEKLDDVVVDDKVKVESEEIKK